MTTGKQTRKDITPAEEQGFRSMGWDDAIHVDSNGTKYVILHNGMVVGSGLVS